MTATQGEIVIAYITLANMGARMLPAKTAYQLYLIKKALEPTYNFQMEEETKYAKSLGIEIQEDGGLKFPDEDTKAKFVEYRKNLYENSIDLTVDIPEIRTSDLKEIRMSEIESLESFIKFV